MPKKDKKEKIVTKTPSYIPNHQLDLVDKMLLTYKNGKNKYSIIVTSTEYAKNDEGFLVSICYDAFTKGFTEESEIYKLFKKIEKFCRNTEDKLDAFIMLINAAKENQHVKGLRLRYTTIPVFPSEADVKYVKDNVIDPILG